MGIRPDDIDDSQIQIETYGDTVIEADVTGYELLGSEGLPVWTQGRRQRSEITSDWH